MIGDNQIQASSSFEHASVGPHNARYIIIKADKKNIRRTDLVNFDL